MTRAKFYCAAVEDWGQTKKVKMTAVIPREGEDSPENIRFFKASPGGEFWINVDNPAAQPFFVQGGYYYFDISRAD